MKRLIIMLLIACSAIAIATAQNKSKATAGHTAKYVLNVTDNEQRYPLRVFRRLREIRDQFGLKAGQTYSVLKNPNTGLVEAAERITRFSCSIEELKTIDQIFMDDEPFSYQILHLLPGNTQQFDIKVVSADGQRSKTLPLRTKSTQEMWYLAAKNLENPQLRDVYAIVWETDDFEKTAEGTIYGIASLRPDLYTKNQETSKKTFKIEGRVDANIKDSLYNIYIANSAQELANIGDDDYVACVPVINKRFEWQTELDHPVAGRLRCIFPDGELCSAWINLDFVPGETYRITVHNGYYDEDRDYERRVGRYSGKSLLNSRQIARNDDVSIVAEEDTVVVDSPTNWEPSPALKMQLEVKGKAMWAKMESVKALYRSLDPKNSVSWMRKDLIFVRITKQNKEVDAAFHDILKFLKDIVIPVDERAEILGKGYEEILEFYTEQNKGLTEMMSSGIQLPKSAKKTQKALNKYIEKYMTEMTKLIE